MSCSVELKKLSWRSLCARLFLACSIGGVQHLSRAGVARRLTRDGGFKTAADRASRGLEFGPRLNIAGDHISLTFL